MSLAELQDDLGQRGEKPFRGKQIYQWMHVKLARDFGEMTNLSKVLRENCESWYTYTSLPYGMPVLRLHPGRLGAEPPAF